MKMKCVEKCNSDHVNSDQSAQSVSTVRDEFMSHLLNFDPKRVVPQDSSVNFDQKNMASATVNTDLARERKRGVFDPIQLTYVLYNGPERLRRKRYLRKKSGVESFCVLIEFVDFISRDCAVFGHPADTRTSVR